MDLTGLNLGLDGLLLDDYSGNLSTQWDTSFPLTLTSNNAAFGFDNSIVPLPYLGGYDLTHFGDYDFGPELAPRFLRDYRTYPIDPELVKKHRYLKYQKYATVREGGRRERRRRRKHHHHRSDHESDDDTPRADGPGYYDTAHYGSDRSPMPTPQDQSVGSCSSNPPPAPAPPPVVSSSTQGSQENNAAPGGPPVTNEAGGQSSSSSSSSSSESDSDSEGSSDTPIHRDQRGSKERGRPKSKKGSVRRPPDDRNRSRRKHRNRTPEEFYRVERARGISPSRNPPSYEEYRRFYQRPRSPSPDSISSRSSSADSYRYGRRPRGFFEDKIKSRKLFKAASKCTADYLTRLKVMAPRRNTSPPWVKNIADMFFRLGFTVVDAVYEDSEGIITILSPPELVAREIEHLPYEVQTAIISIRAARVCRRNGGYNMQVW